jgi:hypothetical protein
MPTDYTIEVAQDAPAVLGWRTEWEDLCRDVNAAVDLYLTIISGSREIERPHAIALKQASLVKSILACRIEKRRIRIPLGYRALWTPTMRLLSVVHGGMLGENSEESAALLIKSASSMLAGGEVDAALFYGIDVGSPLHSQLKRAGGLLTRDLHPEILHRWRMRLPGTYEELYKSRSANTRHNLKRYSKRLLRALGGRLETRTFRGTIEFDSMWSDTEEIARKSHLRALGVGFRNDAEVGKFAQLTASKGWFRAYILYADGEPCAFWNGALYHRTFFTWTTGYDPKLAELRPGTFLLQRMLEDLCSGGDVDEVDFGFGDAQYKRDWCDNDHLQASMLLFAPALKSVSINVYRSAVLGAASAARSYLIKTGLINRFKKAWRTRLARQKETITN